MSKNASVTDISNKTDNTEKLTKDEKIYQQIYTAIVDHQLAPDTKLPEDALAESFNVSRTIIRKVLLGLSHEGLVTTAPKRGARVAHPSIQEGKEIFEARRLIEVAALPIIIEKIDAASLKHLKDLNDRQRSAQQALDFKKAIRLSGEFHLALMLASENISLYEYLRRLVSRSSLIVAIYGSKQQQEPSCQGHSELLNFISKKDIKNSKKWMNDHLIDVEGSLDFTEPNKGNPNFKELFS